MTTATATTSPTIAAAVNLGELTAADTTPVWTDDQWADYINAPEANPVLAIIERGKRLKERRAACNQKGERLNTFEVFLCGNLGMKPAMGSRYVAIGTQARVFLSVKDSLPPSVGTLYELTRLTKTEFDQAIQSGAIHPEMTRAEAEALRSNRPALPASSNQAPQARDNAPSPAPTPPPVSPPPADDGDEDTPFDLGPPVFTDTSTAPTPAHVSHPTPQTGNSNDAFAHQRVLLTRTETNETRSIKEVTDRMVGSATHMQVLRFAQQRMFTNIHTRVSQAQGSEYTVVSDEESGETASFLDAAIVDTVQEVRQLKNSIIEFIENLFDDGIEMFEKDCSALSSLGKNSANLKMMYQGFRLDTSEQVAVSSLTKLIERCNQN